MQYFLTKYLCPNNPTGKTPAGKLVTKKSLYFRLLMGPHIRRFFHSKRQRQKRFFFTLKKREGEKSPANQDIFPKTFFVLIFAFSQKWDKFTFDRIFSPKKSGQKGKRQKTTIQDKIVSFSIHISFLRTMCM